MHGVGVISPKNYLETIGETIPRLVWDDKPHQPQPEHNLDIVWVKAPPEVEVIWMEKRKDD